MTDTATAETAEITASLGECSRCEKALDTTGYPRWCKSCRAKNRREYESLRKQLAETRGFSAGSNAMRAYLADAFAEYPDFQRFSGHEIARVIRNVTGPALPLSE